MELDTRGFKGSLMTNRNSKFQNFEFGNLKWRSNMADQNGKKLVDSDVTWYSGIFGLADYEP